LHIGNSDIGLLAAVSTAVGAVATLPLGALTDRVNRTRLLTAAIGVWSAAEVLSGASNSFLMLLLTRVALGAVVATAGPVVASLTGDLFPAAARGRIYGRGDPPCSAPAALCRFRPRSHPRVPPPSNPIRPTSASSSAE